ncbi:succinylglutamate desuccinylase/aspartoacylase family protein [Fodinicurvata sediminis]|uniref:succinylglutamate desuccinylase/aspartoacylase family protein n=1 Tax=Fodinicurvata sediminis TaxID=1121832 RepID=UPI0003B52E08|nr:succinylglutamate desuccinylase/aspartoacylase family protein [Fodinicurvata sediminis]
MSHSIERQILKGSPPGTEHQLLIHRFGPSDAKRKAYIQASLHADETPAMLVAQHLLTLLHAASSANRIQGQITLVPYANPIGLSQFINGVHLGRHDLGEGGNFNRSWPDLFELALEELSGKLGHDIEQNRDTIRKAMRSALASMEPRSESGHLKQLLALEACDADLVLDLHCDDDALMHLYLTPHHWPEGQGLAADLACAAVLLAEDSGGGSFDEAFSTPWPRLAEVFPDVPIPRDGCFSATIELRGQADVDDHLAAKDAQAIFRELQRSGLVEGQAEDIPALQCEATALEACEILRAPATGIVVYQAELGQQVTSDTVIAELVDPEAEDDTTNRQSIRAGTSGLLLCRRLRKYVQAGESIAKIAGRDPLPERKGLLLDD